MAARPTTIRISGTSGSSIASSQEAWVEQHPATFPGRRNLYGATLDAAGERWYVVSGNTPQGAVAETWVYDIAAATWAMLAASGEALPARYSSDAAIVGSDLYVYGGHDGNAELADTWRLAVTT